MMTRTDKINRIIDAALYNNFSDDIDDIEMLSYTKDGQTYNDRFDYINTTIFPISIHFIGGTGSSNFCVPLSHLTDQSLDILNACII